MIQRGLSLLFWAFLTLSSLVLFPIAVVIWAVTAPFDRRRVVLHQFTCFWASLYTWFNPLWPVTITGREHMRDDRTYVIVANHRSLLDVLVMFRLFRHFKWVSKIEIFKVPCIGWNMSLNGYVKLRRGDAASIAEMMAACERLLAEGNSIMMFPEGTRSVDGRLRAFKHGAFTLAQRARVALLPVVVTGTSEALPKRGFVLRGRHDIRVRILEEIPYESFAGQSVEELMESVRQLFQRELGEGDEPVVEGATARAG